MLGYLLKAYLKVFVPGRQQIIVAAKTNHVLVTGPSGSGKTTLCTAFVDRFGADSPPAIDLDSTTIFTWGRDGKRLERSAPFIDILRNPPFWDIGKLKGLLRENDEIFVFGISFNMPLAVTAFDRVIYLDAPKELLARRLENERENPFASTDAQKRFVLALAGAMNLTARTASRFSRKIEVVDASLPIEELLSRICRDAESPG